jgi:holo-[acyl-carrier protein] synthase
MILGIGCDIVKIERISGIYAKLGTKFLNKVFTAYEIEHAPQLEGLLIPYLAKRFAVKEAFAKALGTGIGKTISFKDIEVFKNNNSQPQVRLLKKLDHIGKIHVSISDDTDYALAFITIENKP